MIHRLKCSGKRGTGYDRTAMLFGNLVRNSSPVLYAMMNLSATILSSQRRREPRLATMLSALKVYSMTRMGSRRTTSNMLRGTRSTVFTVSRDMVEVVRVKRMRVYRMQTVVGVGALDLHEGEGKRGRERRERGKVIKRDEYGAYVTFSLQHVGLVSKRPIASSVLRIRD